MTFWHLENSPYIAFLPWINDKIPLLSLPNTSWSCGTCGIYSELTAFFYVTSVDQLSWSKNAENKKYLQTQSNLELKCDTRRWNNGVINGKKGKKCCSHIPSRSASFTHSNGLSVSSYLWKPSACPIIQRHRSLSVGFNYRPVCQRAVATFLTFVLTCLGAQTIALQCWSHNISCQMGHSINPTPTWPLWRISSYL